MAIATQTGSLYAGGHFTTAGGVSANYIAKWNGSSWSALGSGVSYPNGFPEVYALVLNGNELFVGGLFDMAGGKPSNLIGLWHTLPGDMQVYLPLLIR